MRGGKTVSGKLRRPPGAALISLGAVLAIAIAAVPSLAGHQPQSVASYTGCLKNGKIDDLAIGDSPAQSCRPDVEVHLSGGDITGVVTDTSLVGGGSEGTVGLGVNPAVVQRRVVGRCDQAGRDASIDSINVDGTVTCNTDDVGKTPLTAQVLANGAVLSGHGVVAVHHDAGSGLYLVQFNQTVKWCPAVATWGGGAGETLGKLQAYDLGAYQDDEVAVINEGGSDLTFSLAVFC
jgi:hypothetical protein